MGLSQEQAAALYGVTERSWRRYECGDRRVPAALLHWMRLWEFHDRHVVTVTPKKNLR